MYTTFTNGFCYARYFLNNSGQSISYTKPIIEIGKFIGEFPFEITASGFYKSKGFSKKIIINEGDFVNPIYKNHTFWTGNYICSLEKTQQQTNEVVSEIIHQSMENRILSLYTAFLALEQGDTIRPGEQPEDDENNEHQTSYKDSKLNQGVNVTVNASPNPFASSTSISITMPENISSADVGLKICDIMGQPVKSIDVSSLLKMAKSTYHGMEIMIQVRCCQTEPIY